MMAPRSGTRPEAGDTGHRSSRLPPGLLPPPLALPIDLLIFLAAATPEFGVPAMRFLLDSRDSGPSAAIRAISDECAFAITSESGRQHGFPKFDSEPAAGTAE